MTSSEALYGVYGLQQRQSYGDVVWRVVVACSVPLYLSRALSHGVSKAAVFSVYIDVLVQLSLGRVTLSTRLLLHRCLMKIPVSLELLYLAIVGPRTLIEATSSKARHRRYRTTPKNYVWWFFRSSWTRLPFPYETLPRTLYDFKSQLLNFVTLQ